MPQELAAVPAAAGHFDELHAAVVAPDGSLPGPLAAHWSDFFTNLQAGGATELNQRAQSLERQIRDNGVTYNVYADSGGPQRPWSLDLFPLIITPESWQQIEAGVLQRVRLLDQVMADVYGPQQLLARGLLPPALVQGHPGYLRAMHGVRPPAARIFISQLSIWRAVPMATGGWFRNAPKRPPVWVICWKTASLCRAFSQRPSPTCRCSGWPAPTGR